MPSRDVIFNLKIQAGDTSELKRFADEVAAAQKKMTASTAAGAKQRVDDDTKARNAMLAIHQRADAQEARGYLKSIDDRKKAAQQHADWYTKLRQRSAQLEQQETLKSIAERRKVEQQQAEWKENIRRKSAMLEQQENLKAIQAEKLARANALKEMERERVASIRRMAVEENRQRTMNIRQAGGYSALASGIGSVASGLAYSGMIGEQNSQNVLNTVLAVQGGQHILQGGMNMARGANAAFGIPMGAGGAGGAAAAGIAAIAAWLPAIASGLQGLSVILSGSSVTGRGDIRGGLGEGVARTYSGAFGLLSKRTWGGDAGTGRPDLLGLFSNPRGGGENLGTPYFGAAFSGQAYNAQLTARAERQKRMAVLSGDLAEAGSLRLEGVRGNLGAARAGLRSAVGDYSTAKSVNADYSVQQQAARNIKTIQEEILRINREQAATVVQGARTHYDILKRTADDAINKSKEARRNLQSDLIKFASASPFEQARVQNVSAKLRAGTDLNAADVAIASQYNAFETQAASQAEKLARASGAGDIFGAAISDKKRLEAEAVKAAEEAGKAVVTLAQKMIVEVLVKHDDFADTDLKLFKPVLDEIAERDRQQIINIENKIKQASQALRPPIR